MLYQILVFTMHGKILKSHIRVINLKYQLEHGMKNSNYLNYFKCILKKHGEKNQLISH